MIVGGKSDGRSAIRDSWIHDLTTMKWKKVICIVLYCTMYIRYCMFGFGLQLPLPLPDTVTERMYHSLSAIQLTSHNVLLVAFGGMRSLSGAKLSHTVLIQLSEYYCSIYTTTLYNSDRHCTLEYTDLDRYSVFPCSSGRRWAVGDGEDRSSLGRQEGVPADVVRKNWEQKYRG